MVVDAAPFPGMVRVRHLVVPDHVRAVGRDQVGVGQPGGQPGRAAVLGVGEAGDVGEPGVLDADRALVVGPVAGVPGDVAVGHHLRHATGRGDDVVRGRLGAGIAKPGVGRGPAALGHVDHEPGDRARQRPVGDGVVQRAGRLPQGSGVVRPGGGRRAHRMREQRPGRRGQAGRVERGARPHIGLSGSRARHADADDGDADQGPDPGRKKPAPGHVPHDRQ